MPSNWDIRANRHNCYIPNDATVMYLAMDNEESDRDRLSEVIDCGLVSCEAIGFNAYTLD